MADGKLKDESIKGLLKKDALNIIKIGYHPSAVTLPYCMHCRQFAKSFLSNRHIRLFKIQIYFFYNTVQFVRCCDETGRVFF
jgi:hypothetical protein